jgi:hypothetical protein
LIGANVLINPGINGYVQIRGNARPPLDSQHVAGKLRRLSVVFRCWSAQLLEERRQILVQLKDEVGIGDLLWLITENRSLIDVSVSRTPGIEKSGEFVQRPAELC